MGPHCALEDDRIFAHLAGAQYGDRGRHHQGDAVAAGEGAEIRQHQGEVAQVLGGSAAPVRRLFLHRNGRTQFVRRFALDVAHHRKDQSAGRVDGYT